MNKIWKRFRTSSIASLLFLCSYATSAQTTATDIYNKAVKWTNLVKADKFTYTKTLIHTPDDAVLLKVANKINRSLQMAQDSFEQLAEKEPVYAQELLAFKNWIRKEITEFDYPALKKELEGTARITPRQQLQRLRVLDAKEGSNELEKLCSNIFKRFCKVYQVLAPPADTAEAKHISQINRAIYWSRKAELTMLEAKILMDEYTDAFNHDNLDSMAITHKSLLLMLPDAQKQAKALQPANQAERDLVNRAMAVLALVETFTSGKMPTHIGLKKKYLSHKRNDVDTEAMDRITSILSEKYVPKIKEFHDGNEIFLKQRVPKPAE